MFILSLESTFDDTCVCLLNFKKKKSFEIKITKKKYKELGVIPKKATNNHIKNFKKIFSIIKKYYNFKNISFISFTNRPGLPGSINVSRIYSYAISKIIKKKVIKINHLHSHIFSNFIGKKINFPFISFLISGANTIFYKVKSISSIKKIGKTIDNSVGEVMNKLGRIVKKKYPIHNYIEKNYIKKNIIKNKINLPVLKKKKNISLSGIYTKYKNYYIKKMYSKKKIIISFFSLIIKIIKEKIKFFYNKYNIKKFYFCGGVSKNKILRKINFKNAKIYFAKKKFCEDNATMVANITFLKNGFLY
ncbi:hypothetical protein ACWNYI_00250 [Candidatus Vidania fulgoroideorum]